MELKLERAMQKGSSPASRDTAGLGNISPALSLFTQNPIKAVTRTIPFAFIISLSFTLKADNEGVTRGQQKQPPSPAAG